MKYYLDCEFDGHGGPLLSMALVHTREHSIHIMVAGVEPKDPWVRENVLPVMPCDPCMDFNVASIHDVGWILRDFLENDPEPDIISDSPVDIWRFCQALSTGRDGQWHSSDFDKLTFEVHNVDCYPTTLDGAVQHNAWWDAMALKEKLNV